MRKLAATQESAFNVIIRKCHLTEDEQEEGRLALVKIARAAADIRLSEKRIAINALTKAVNQQYLKTEGVPCLLENLKKTRGFNDKLMKKATKSVSRSRSRSTEGKRGKAEAKSISRSRSRSSEKEQGRKTRSRSRSNRGRSASREATPLPAASSKRKTVVSSLMGHTYGKIENQGFLTNMLSTGRMITFGNNPALGELLSTQLGDKSCILWSPRTAAQIAKYKVILIFLSLSFSFYIHSKYLMYVFEY